MLTIVAVALGLYVTLGVILTLAQRSLLYVPDRTRVDPATLGLDLREVMLVAPDGARLVTWRAAAMPGQPTLLYLHGNGGHLGYRADRFAALRARGYGLLALSWRGYGGSDGAPSQAALLADALLAYDTLRAEGVAAAAIVPFGESLGTAAAVHIAAHRPVGAVVLQSPFTSIADVAQSHYPFYPVRLMLRDPYPTIDWIGMVQAPLLVAHGRRDSVVPFASGEALFAAATVPKRLFAVAEGGHNDLGSHGLMAAVTAFLADPPR